MVYMNYSHSITINSHGLCELFVNFGPEAFSSDSDPDGNYDGPGSKSLIRSFTGCPLKETRVLNITPLQNENHIQVVEFQPSSFRV